MSIQEPASPLPRSIAIAGAWGYIGRKFLDVALANGLETYVFDPGPMPEDVDRSRFDPDRPRGGLLPARRRVIPPGRPPRAPSARPATRSPGAAR